MQYLINDDEIIALLEQKRIDWLLDPILFTREFLGIGVCSCRNSKPCVLDANQKTALIKFAQLCLAKTKKYTTSLKLTSEEEEIVSKLGASIQSGKGVGKTTIAAITAIWFFVCFPMARVVILGPKYDQIKDNLWPEIGKWLNHAVKVFGEDCLANRIIEKQADKYFMKGIGGSVEKDKWVIKILTFPKNSSVEDQKAAVQGQHDDNMIFIIDEASGVPDSIFEPIESTCTSVSGANAVFAIFNPNKNNGWAIETQGKMKDKWLCLRINAENSDIVSKEHIAYLALKYGVDSSKYRVSVLGLPPIADKDVLIAWSFLEEAKERGDYSSPYYVHPDEEAPLIYGVDVGGGGSGDVSIICRRQGYGVFPSLTSNCTCLDTVCDWVMGVLDRDQPLVAVIDMNGLGRGLHDRLKRLGYRVIGVNSQNSTRAKEKFYRIRDELYWSVKTNFDEGNYVIYPDEKGVFDDELTDELSLHTYDDQGTEGKIKVSSKKNSTFKREMKSSLGYDSPNKADALSLTEKFNLLGYFINKGMKNKLDRNRTNRNNKNVKRSVKWMGG